MPILTTRIVRLLSTVWLLGAVASFPLPGEAANIVALKGADVDV
ncbi:MAG: hypothetical protein HW376_243 [candidate division NC10 bacterium]|nr:hypothetical protein [candidate division NC10 bacterium]